MIKTKLIICIMTALLLSILVLNVEISAVYIILPSLSHFFSVGTFELSWIVTLYMMFFGAFLVVSGRLGDLYGCRNIMLIGLVIFTLGSLLGGLAPTFSLLLIARVLQGLACALIWPNSTALAFLTMPPKYKSLGIGLVTGVVGFSLALGPLLGGYLTLWFGWRGVFLFNVPITILAFLVTWLFLENKKNQHKNRLDLLSSLLIVIVLAGLILSLSELIKPGGALFAALSFILAVIALIIFIVWEKRSRSPLLPLALLRNRAYKFGCVYRGLTVMPFYIVMMVVSLFAQKNLDFSAAGAGLLMLPMTLLIGVMSPIGGGLINRLGMKMSLQAAAIAYVTGFVILLLGLSTPSVWLLIIVMLFIGIGFALASPAALTVSLKFVDRENQGAASGVFYMASAVSGLLGVTFASAAFQYWPGTVSLSYMGMFAVSLFCIICGLLAIIISQLLSSKKNKFNGMSPTLE